jgi:hypothetical protein
MSAARNRFVIISLSRLVSALAAGGGVVLLGQAEGWGQRIAATCIVIGGLGLMVFVPRALASRWATPRDK